MLLGIDIGTQSLKAIVTDAGLTVRGFAQQAYEPSYPKVGWAEQDPRLWEAALGPAVRSALASAGIAATGIKGIGLCGQLDGCIPVDDAGRAQGNCLIWIDRRAQAEIDDIAADVIHCKTGIVADASHQAAKIRWLKRRNVEAVRFHQPVSYMVEQLTGANVIDHALASTGMIYGLKSRAYDADLLARFAIEERELPELAEAQACAGLLTEKGAGLTGLPAGVPVSVGTGDDFASPLGAGVGDDQMISVAVGTGEVVGRLSREPLVDAGRLVETHAFPGGGYFLENPGWLAGGAVVWLMRVLGIDRFEKFDALASEVPSGSDGLLFLPALTGAMSPEWIAGARGCFYGLTPAHGPGHMARALMEGCAFAMRDVIERLQQLGGAPREIMFSGGGSRSRLWAQIHADVAGLPLSIAASAHAAVMGAAMLGGVACGTFATLAEAQGLLPKPIGRLNPDPQIQRELAGSYRRYRALFSALKPLFSNAASAEGQLHAKH